MIINNTCGPVYHHTNKKHLTGFESNDMYDTYMFLEYKLYGCDESKKLNKLKYCMNVTHVQ